MTENSPESGLQPAVTTSTSNWKRFVLDLLETLFLSVVLFLAIDAVSARVRVEGYSMRPTLDDHQYVLISRLAYRLDEPQRGDIIVFRPPMYPQESFFKRFTGLPDEWEDYIKRVIGLPGEEVRIENGHVYINGEPLDELYITASPNYMGIWNVPEGYLFVLGDNRNNSSDSHSWGLLPMENVVGKAILVYWPPLKWNVLNHDLAAAAAP